VFALGTSATIDTVVILAAGVIGLWRGYRRRRAYWTSASWVAFAATVLIGLAMSGWSLYFSAAVDHHAAWVGGRGSTTRAAWALLGVVCLTGGGLLTAFAIGWFAQGKAKRPFPLLGRGRGASLKAIAGEVPFGLSPDDLLEDDDEEEDDEVYIERR
jgi:hypothetical protein